MDYDTAIARGSAGLNHYRRLFAIAKGGLNGWGSPLFIMFLRDMFEKYCLRFLNKIISVFNRTISFFNGNNRKHFYLKKFLSQNIHKKNYFLTVFLAKFFVCTRKKEYRVKLEILVQS